MNAPFENVYIEDSNLRSHYEQVTADWLLSIARWKYLISAFVLGAIVLAAFLIPMLPRTYTAQALIYPDITSAEASLNGIAIVSSEAELIKSKVIAADVVKRLGLDSNPAFISAPSRLDILRNLRSIIMPKRVHDKQFAGAVARLQSRLQVDTNNNTYVITVRYTAASPDLAATIANAILFAYQRLKQVDRKAREVRVAKEELVKLSAVIGKRHPSFLQAEAKLSNAMRELQIAVDVPSDSDADRKGSGSMVLADPVTTLSNSTGPAVLGVAAILGLFTGLGVGMWLDRRDNGFGASDDVAAYTSTRCIGLVPCIPSREIPKQLSRVREVLRAIAVEAGLEGSEGSKKVVLVTTIESPAGALHITEALGRVLVAAGQRVLLVDAGPAAIPVSSADDEGEELVSLDDVLADEDLAHAFFEANQDKKSMAVIKRAEKSKIGDEQFAICSGPLSRFVAATRKHYDVVLIESSLTLHPVDTALIGRESDVTLLVARWKSTPRHAVNSAIKRLHDFGVPVNGVVLSDVKVDRYHRRGALKHLAWRSG